MSIGVSLDYQVCRLGKQVQLPYLHSEIVSRQPFDLVHLMFRVQLTLHQKEAIANILSL